MGVGPAPQTTSFVPRFMGTVGSAATTLFDTENFFAILEGGGDVTAYAGAWSSNENNVRTRVGGISHSFVRMIWTPRTTVGAGRTLTLAVRVNGVDSALTLSITNANAAGVAIPIVATVGFANLDYIDMRVVGDSNVQPTTVHGDLALEGT